MASLFSAELGVDRKFVSVSAELLFYFSWQKPATGRDTYRVNSPQNVTVTGGICGRVPPGDCDV